MVVNFHPENPCVLGKKILQMVQKEVKRGRIEKDRVIVTRTLTERPSSYFIDAKPNIMVQQPILKVQRAENCRASWHNWSELHDTTLDSRHTAGWINSNWSWNATKVLSLTNSKSEDFKPQGVCWKFNFASKKDIFHEWVEWLDSLIMVKNLVQSRSGTVKILNCLTF